MPAKKQHRIIRGFFAGNKRGLLTSFARWAGREEASGLLQETFARALR
jgi:hypothetical protein